MQSPTILYDHARKVGNRGDVWKHFILMTVLGRKVSHDHLFHSVLDCADIQSPIVLQTMSVCRGLE